MLWVRCSRKAEIFTVIPRRDRKWNPHAGYHLNGNFHHKSHGPAFHWTKRQPLTETFRGSECLGAYGGHGENSGAVYDPEAFTGAMIVKPGILGPVHGHVEIDIVEPGYDPTPDPNVYARNSFPRGRRPRSSRRNAISRGGVFHAAFRALFQQYSRQPSFGSGSSSGGPPLCPTPLMRRTTSFACIPHPASGRTSGQLAAAPRPGRIRPICAVR